MAAEAAVARFAAAAAALGVEVVPVRYPAGTRTAVDAAAAIGCEVSQIVKSLVCIGPDGPLLALTAGHNRIDLDRLAALAGRSATEVRMATPDEARAATGYAVGGTPPLGHRNPIPTWIDCSVFAHEVVHGAAGTPDSCFAVEPGVLLKATGGVAADFGV